MLANLRLSIQSADVRFEHLSQLISHGVDPITLSDTFDVAETFEHQLITNETQAIHTILTDHANTLNFHIFEKIWDHLNNRYTSNVQLQLLRSNVLIAYGCILSNIAILHVKQCQAIKCDHITTSISQRCCYCIRQAVLCRYRMNFAIMSPLLCDHDCNYNNIHIKSYALKKDCKYCDCDFSTLSIFNQFDITTYTAFDTCPWHKQENVIETIGYHLSFVDYKLRVGYAVTCTDRLCAFLASVGNFTKGIQIFKRFLSKTMFSNDDATVIKFCNSFDDGIMIVDMLRVYQNCLLNLNCRKYSKQLCVQFDQFLKTYMYNKNNSNTTKPILIQSVSDQVWQTTASVIDEIATSIKVTQRATDFNFLANLSTWDQATRNDITSFLIFCKRWQDTGVCMNGFCVLYEAIYNKVDKFKRITIEDINDCAIAAHISSRLYSISISHGGDNIRTCAGNIFCKTFKAINRALFAYPKSEITKTLVATRLQCEDSIIWNEKRNPAIFNLFFCYAVFLLSIKSNDAEKYFEYCLSLRPTNGYLHYVYSSYLMIVMKKYKQSYFHLRMSKRLWPGLHDQNQNQSIRTDTIDTNKQKNEKKTERITRRKNGKHRKSKFTTAVATANATNYKLCMTLIGKHMQTYHRCYLNQCDKVLKKEKLLVCRGCKSAHYCSKLCQKKDWKFKHRNECVDKYLKKLNRNEKRIYNQILQMLDV